jgi:hypothetical protein
MKKQPFTIEGSVALKKALVEETGVRVFDEDSCTEWNYLQCDTDFLGLQGCKTQLPIHYQLPEDWNAAVQAVKDFFAEDKLEAGKWYYAEYKQNKYEYLLKYQETRPIYGLKDEFCYNDVLYVELIKKNPFGDVIYSINNFISSTDLEQALQPATTEQIQEMLGKVAKQKGYVEDANIRSLISNYNLKLKAHHPEYDSKYDALWVGGCKVYNKGKWAELLPKEKPKPKFESGKWYYAEYDGGNYLLKYQETRHTYGIKGKFHYNEIHYSEYIEINPNGIIQHWTNDYIGYTELEQALQPATKEQIRVMLGKVAKQKGYVENVEIKSLIKSRNVKLLETPPYYEIEKDRLWMGNCIAYEKGKWAEF